jgi:hypothetical protein
MSVTKFKLGDVNENGQKVVADLKRKSSTRDTANLYHMVCELCSCEYAANGFDVHDRKCPSCQGGRPGEAVHQ